VTSPQRAPGGFPVVGIIGGGQLARMCQPPAVGLAITLSVLAEAPDASAALVVPSSPVGSHADLEAVRAFARDCDVVTFDHEHVPADVLAALEADGVALHPTPAALVFAQDLSHPSSLAQALIWAAWFHQYRREGQIAQDYAEAAIVLATDQGFQTWLGQATVFRGKARAEQGQEEAGIAQMRQGIAMQRDIGVGVTLPYYLALLAEAQGKANVPQYARPRL